MDKETHVVGIIPARAGSKSIPRKNVQDLANKPLIVYTIDVALKSKTLCRVVVSTDDAKIAELARSYRAEVPFMRPAELARDDTPGLLACQHAVKYLEENEGYKVDVVVILQPTSPLRNESHIDKAVRKLLRTRADSVITVCKVRHHPFWSFIARGDRLYPFSKMGITIRNRQALPEIYAVNGAVYAVRKNVLFEQNSVFGKDTRAIVMPSEESVDIDSPFDFFVAEMLLKHWNGWLHEKSKDWG